ncbi:hypothetical protein WICPIJ_002170 [Wickerhamomyces pijperi]|uniref:Uncharacterized protein n=1 Tax=Wickerhamomyces pijperi TaxID=599730 RepID=A0A9P8Q9L2_WICPI|nr:hypothetical protein WICPIJ_002170 [Wickerhamomyces pijperi]
MIPGTTLVEELTAALETSEKIKIRCLVLSFGPPKLKYRANWYRDKLELSVSAKRYSNKSHEMQTSSPISTKEESKPHSTKKSSNSSILKSMFKNNKKPKHFFPTRGAPPVEGVLANSFL